MKEHEDLKDMTSEGDNFSTISSKTKEPDGYGFSEIEMSKFVERNKPATETQKEPQPIKKPPVVTVTRYFRRWNHELQQIESNGGVTAICELNYETKLMTVYPAFCSDNDNFNKGEGFRIANINRSNDIGICFYFDKKKSIESNISIAFRNNHVDGTSKCDSGTMKKMIRLFYNAMKPIKNCSPAIA